MQKQKIRTAKVQKPSIPSKAPKGWPENPPPGYVYKSKEELKEIYPDKAPEAVDHPSHYQGQKFEVIDIIEDFELSFNLGNAIKYILRCDKKGRRAEDLKKAIWYLQREIV